MATEARSATMELHLLAESMARNIKDRKVGKSRSLRVGRCLGLIEIAPVVGSMTMLWRVESAPEMMIPLAVPGAAMYGSLFGSGVFSMIEIGVNLLSCPNQDIFLTERPFLGR